MRKNEEIEEVKLEVKEEVKENNAVCDAPERQNEIADPLELVDISLLLQNYPKVPKIKKYDSQSYESAYFLAKGFLYYFSKSTIEINKIIDALEEDEDETTYQFKNILSYFAQINTISDLIEKLQSLWEAIEDEDLLEFENVKAQRETINWWMSKLISIVNSLENRTNFKELSIAFHDLIQCIQPLDISLMMSLIENFETAANLLAGKDIILLLGETGAGKSTTIHFLAGSEMEGVFVDGFEHIQPKSISALVQDIKVGVSTQSVTKSITAITLPPGLVICDTPGFGDTAGPETDIANGIGMINSLKSAKSVKPVMVLSDKNMDRLKGVRKMKAVMSAMIVDIHSVLPSMTYLFTKYQVKFAPFMVEQLKLLRREFTETDLLDPNYIDIVEDMIVKTNPIAIIIDPLSESSKSLSKDDILEKISNLPSITNPQDTFRTFASPESSAALASQWKVLQRQVHFGLKRENIDFLPKYFKEMQVLNKLNLEEHSPIFNDSIRLLENYCSHQLELGKEIFDSCLLHHVSSSNISSELSRAFDVFRMILSLHTLLVELISEYDFSTLVQSYILDALTKLISIDDYNRISSNFALMTEIVELIQTTFTAMDVEAIPDNEETKALHSHPLFGIPQSFFDTANHCSFDYLTLLMNSLANLSTTLKEDISHDNSPVLIAEHLKKLHVVIPILSTHLKDDKFENELKELQIYFWNHLQNTSDECLAILYPPFGRENFKSPIISHFCTHLSLLKNTPDLSQYFPGYYEQLSQIQSNFVENASKKFQKIKIDCLNILNSAVPAYEFYHYYQEYLNFISEVPMLAEHVNRLILELSENLQKELMVRTNVIYRGITQLGADGITQEESDKLASTIKNSVEYLAQAKSVFNHHSDDTINSMIEEVVGNRLKQLEAFKSKPIDLYVTHKLISNLTLTWYLKDILPTNSSYTKHLLLRSDTIEFIRSSFGQLFIDLTSATLFQYRGISELVQELHQFTTSDVGRHYTDFDQIFEEMKTIGHKLLDTKREILFQSFDFIQSCWNSQGTFRPLPDDQFTTWISRMRSILEEFREIHQGYCSYPPGLSRDLLYEIPNQLYVEWVTGDHSKLNLHISELSNYVTHRTNKMDIEETSLIYQLLVLSQEMRPLDKYLKSATTYSALHNNCQDLILKFSSDSLKTLETHLDNNSFTDAYNLIFEISASTIYEINSSTSQIQDILKNHAGIRCKKLQSQLKKLETINFNNDLISELKAVILERNYLKLFSNTLLENLDQNTFQLLETTAETFPKSIDIMFRYIISKIILSPSNLSENLKNLDLIGDLAHEISSGPLSLANIGDYEKQRQDSFDKIISNVSDEITKFSTISPADYEKVGLGKLIKQLQQCSRSDTDILLSRLFDTITSTLRDILSDVKNSHHNITESESQIALVKSSLKYLSQTHSEPLQELLNTCEMLVREESDRNLQNLQLQRKQGIHEFSTILQIFENQFDCGDFHSCKETKRALVEIISDECTNFRILMERKDTCILLMNEPKAYHMWKKYLISLDRRLKNSSGLLNTAYGYFFSTADRTAAIRSICSDTLSNQNISNLRNEIFQYMQSQLQEILMTKPSNSGNLFNFLNSLEKITPIVLTFQDVINSQEDYDIKFIDFLVRNTNPPLKKVMSEFFVNVNTFFRSFHEHFQDVLKRKDLQGIKEVMEKLKEYDKMISQLKTNSLGTNDSVIHQIPTYVGAVDKISQKMISWREGLHQQFHGHAQTMTVNSQEKDQFYQMIYSNFIAVKDLRTLASHINPRIFSLDQAISYCEEHIKQQIEQFYHHAERLMNDFPTERHESYDEYNICFENLRSFSAHFRDGKISSQAHNLSTTLDQNFSKRVLGPLREVLLQNTKRLDLNDLVNSLITVKTFGVHIFSVSTQCNSLIDASLTSFMKSNANQIAQLSRILVSFTDPVAKRLLQEHKVFENYQILARNQKTLKFTIDDVLGTKMNEGDREPKFQINPQAKHILRGTELHDVNQRILIRRLYDQFEIKYWDNVDKGYHLGKPEQSNYLSTLVQKAKSISNEKTKSIYDIYQELAPLVFAYWTLEKWCSREVVDENDGISHEELLQPHAAQIVAIYRLLGIDCGDMTHHLAQISTGEGKSVTLAGIAVILALTDNIVDCVCYSEYLTQRDYRDFLPLFRAFGVHHNIKYCTFHNLSEFVVNRQGDVRQCVQQLIDPSQPNQTSSLNKISSSNNNQQSLGCRRILLIDEVDVFLNEDFYGNFYHPMTKLYHPTISALIDYVWNNRVTTAKLQMKVIKKTQEYANLEAAFPTWLTLFEEMIKSLCCDVLKYPTHDYIVKDGRIGYKDQDSISFTMTFGYQTLFAYYDLREQSIITSNALEKQKYFLIDCGTFAYAEIPKLYHSILGVSGTLETLSEKERELLVNVYHIQKQSIIPSVYGSNKCSFHHESDDDFKIESQQGYHIAIINEIRRRMSGTKNPGYKRAVLVFFESKTRLEEFYKFARPNLVGEQIAIITEETSQIDKEGNIAAAVTPGRITLLTRAFGRGTDFICYDDQLQHNGGIHVLQTFLSFNQSEEIQIRGRTARQGNVGSYSMVLLDQDLEKIGIDDDIIRRMKNTKKYYATLNHYRAANFSIQYAQDIQHVQEIRNDHMKSLEFVTKLLTHSDERAVYEFLLQRNLFFGTEVLVENFSSRTICLLDATSSMSNCIRNAKQSVSKMFARAYDILTTHGIESSFEMQFVAYKNYNAPPEMLLQYSPWSSRPQELQQFLNNVEASYGWGNEAIEIALWHVNQQHANGPIGQVVIIGDKPPNTREETDEKRQQRSWQGTPFETATYFEDELQVLIQNEIKVQAFYVASNARQSFRRMSQLTEGGASRLNVDSPDASEVLTGLVTRHILLQQGGKQRGAELVAAYDAKYGKIGHVAESNTTTSV